MRNPKGHVRLHGTGYQVIVPVGRDPITKRYRYAYRQAATLDEAEKLRDKLLADMAQGRQLRKEATFGHLLDAVLEVAHLDGTTRVIYQGHVEETIRPALGDYRVGYLEQHPELLDRLYAALGRCRRLCGGRRGLIDHRPPSCGERLAAGTPDHECDGRCRPHECRPAEPATVAQVHAIIKGAFGCAVRWEWVGEDPAMPLDELDRLNEEMNGCLAKLEDGVDTRSQVARETGAKKPDSGPPWSGRPSMAAT